MNLKRTLAVLTTAAIAASPAAASARDDHSGSKGKGKAPEAKHEKAPKKPKKAKTATYEFKGIVAAVGADGTVQVTVQGGNSRARKLKGQTLTFDLSTAKKVKVADVNNDGKRDLADVAVGDRVNVQAKLPAGTVDTSKALPARHFVDKGPVPPPDPEDESKDPEDEPKEPEDEPKAPETPPAA